MKPKYVGHYMKEGWKGELPFYLFKCRKHGYVVNYPHGFEEKLTCPECQKEINEEYGEM